MKRLFIIALLLFTTGVFADANISNIRETLKHVETQHNPAAMGDYVNGIPMSYGILQIQQGAIDDVNKEFGTSYTHEDAFSEACSEEIFDLYIQKWANHLEKRQNRTATAEDIVRIWNGGPNGYLRHSTIKYFEKYKKYRYLCNMENKRKCLVGDKLGIVTASYTHTLDVFLFKDRRHMTGVHKRYVKLLPLEKPHYDGAQLTLNYA